MTTRERSYVYKSCLFKPNVPTEHTGIKLFPLYCLATIYAISKGSS